MSSYRRFISYMHQYENEKKGMNCGFVKIEIKNGQCTLLFQMKKLPTNGLLSLSFFIREKISIKCIPIWEGTCPKGILNQRFVTDSLHLFHSDYSFDQCAGIILNQGGQVLCGTCWDKIGTIPATQGSKAVQEEAVPVDEITPEETVHISEIAEKEADYVNEAAHEETGHGDEMIQEKSVPEEAAASPKEPPTPPSFEEIWQSMQKNYPPLDPFEESGIVEGIKVSPSDLPYLHMLQFDLGANRFLLHGYKNYKHLLLGRIEGQNRYILGIPGVYDSQEQFMAKMFGFPCFKPIRPCRKPVGQFGYWFRCIHS